MPAPVLVALPSARHAGHRRAALPWSSETAGERRLILAQPSAGVRRLKYPAAVCALTVGYARPIPTGDRLGLLAAERASELPARLVGLGEEWVLAREWGLSEDSPCVSHFELEQGGVGEATPRRRS
jgi:hypothetical protein